MTKLLEAKKLLLNKCNWATGSLARDHRGNPCDVSAQNACSFCALGAVYKVYGLSPINYVLNKDFTLDLDLVHIASSKMSNYSPGAYNDEASHEDILKMFDIAIELYNKKENKNNAVSKSKYS